MYLVECVNSQPVILDIHLINIFQDIRLKISIIDLLSECVNSQPGMVQLLLDINIHLSG